MTAYEREQSLRELFTNPFGDYNYYQLNASNPVLKLLMSAYADHIGIREPLGDAGRVDAEQRIWDLISFYIRKYDRRISVPGLPEPEFKTLENGIKIFTPMDPDKHISRIFFGWQREQVQIFVNDILVKDKAVELFRKDMENGKQRRRQNRRV